MAVYTGKERLIITSADTNESAYFLNSGMTSFSFFFWSNISNGGSLYDSYVVAQNAIDLYQTSQIDANSNAIGNEKDDDSAADTYTIGNGVATAVDIPSIVSITPAQTLNGETEASVTIELLRTSQITRVWAIVTPPDFYLITSPDTPILNLPSFDLSLKDTNTYEGTYNNFFLTGTYNVTVFAVDENLKQSIPLTTTVEQTSGAASCAYKLTPTSKTFSSSFNNGSITLTTQESCVWNAVSHNDWITITSEAINTGSGVVDYAIAQNETGASRTGTITVGGETVTITQAAGEFNDIDPSDSFSDYIYTIYINGITSGYEDGGYHPDDNVTRAQMALFIIRALGLESEMASSCAGTVFTDVNTSTAGDYFCRAIEKFSELGITSGYADGSFGYNDNVTRAQMALFIVKALGLEAEMASSCAGSVFTDVNTSTVGDYFCRAIEKFAELGITSGYEDGSYGYNNLVTRAQMAAFLTKGFSLQ
ncbi:S-layer homology region domain protein [Candidatus Magnetoovum chiemensis]|nr:S-layer homology region domain protein [Candidatus Magnetoovum chiemensis]